MAYSERRRAALRITATLFAAQSLSSSGVIAAATIASIAGAQISGRAALAGVPASAFQVGAAVAALSWSLASDRLGRRNALALGLVTGAIGAAGAASAVVTRNFALLVAAIVVAGSGSAAVKLGRFAAAEAQPPERRGRAVAWVVLGGTVGSVLGPSLVAPAGSFGSHVLGSSLARPYLVTASASLGGGLLFAAAGYGATGLIGAVASVLLPYLAVGLGRKGRVHPAT